MDSPTQRWYLLRTTTNPHGVTHFTVTCRGEIQDAGYEELLQVLKKEFGAVEDGALNGPYSIHQYMKVDNLRFGIVIEVPEWLDLYAAEQHDVGAMASFVAKLLDTLNGQNAHLSG
jgi:hypothetical protein